MNRYIKLCSVLVLAASPWCSSAVEGQGAAGEDAAILIQSDGTALTAADMTRLLLSIPQEAAVQLLSSEEKYREALVSTYKLKALADIAKKNGIDKLPHIKAKIWHNRMTILARAEKMRYIEEVINAANLDAAATETYASNAGEYYRPRDVEVRHILFDKAGAELVEEVKGKITSGEMQFAEAVERYSEDDGSIESGGYVGWAGKNKFVPEFEKAVLGATFEGELIGPVDTRFGSHLIYIEKIREKEKMSFEEVEKVIKDRIVSRMRSELSSGYLREIDQDASLKVYDEEISRLYHKEKEKRNSNTE